MTVPKSDIQRARIASAVAATVSAFIVFVSGGTLVGIVWLDRESEPEVIEAVEAVVVSEPVVAQPEAPEPVEVVPEPVVEVPKPSVRRRRKRPDPPPREVIAEPAVPTGGRGIAVVYGDADRVEFISSEGIFTAGAIPSGEYVIKATFPDSDPVSAGSARIFPDQTVRVHCSAAHGRCRQQR